MSTTPIPKGLRVGSVPYLNALPLLRGIPRDQLLLLPPAPLSQAWDEGRLDVALLPVFECLGRGGPVVQGVGIACDGPVHSVVLCHAGTFEEIEEVALDPDSRSSNHLCKILLEDHPRGVPQYVMKTTREPPSQGRAGLLIGNPAIDFRRRYNGQLQFTDLGELWKQRTGLPFVFAIWAMRSDLPGRGEIAEALREYAAAGLVDLPMILQSLPVQERGFARSYLTESIRFSLGNAEIAGLAEYGRRVVASGYLPASVPPLEWV